MKETNHLSELKQVLRTTNCQEIHNADWIPHLHEVSLTSYIPKDSSAVFFYICIIKILASYS